MPLVCSPPINPQILKSSNPQTLKPCRSDLRCLRPCKEELTATPPFRDFFCGEKTIRAKLGSLPCTLLVCFPWFDLFLSKNLQPL